MIYLDNNATTLIDPRVSELIKEQIDQLVGNPSSLHQSGQKARQQLVGARRQLAHLLGCSNDELCFTSSATEAINLLLSPKVKPRHIVSSALEHTATLAALRRLEAAGSRVTYLEPELGKGAISPAQIEAALEEQTDLLVFMAANNETGIKSDIEAIAALAEREGIALVVDGVALYGKEPFSLPKAVLGFSLSSHKIHGPKGIALAMIRKPYKVAPLIVGGEQQFSRRAGTEDLIGILAFTKAITLAAAEAEKNRAYMERLRKLLEKGIRSFCPNAQIHGGGEPRVSNVSNISFVDEEAESMVIQLDLAGLCVSHGAACSSGGLEPSHVLRYMGLPADLVRSAIRFSLSRFTTQEEIDRALCVLKNYFGLPLADQS